MSALYQENRCTDFLEPIVEEITFDQIFPLWKQLWPQRQTPIEPVSWMKYKGGYYEIKPIDPKFYGLISGNKLVGCNSLHILPDGAVRSRGLYVLPEYRKHRFGTQLLGTSMIRYLSHCPPSDKTFVWTFARDTSISVYKRCNFAIDGDPVNNPDIGETNFWMKTNEFYS
jgi:GNAT superfamily N-acetyltransferase